jgi:hypothetical protein
MHPGFDMIIGINSREIRMDPVKTGEVLVCEGCGAEVTVTKACECNDCNIVCCGKPMVKKEPKKGCCCCGG